MAPVKTVGINVGDAVIAAYMDVQLEAKRGEYHSQMEPWGVFKERAKMQCLQAFHQQIDRVAAGFAVLQGSDKFTPEEKEIFLEKFRNYQAPNSEEAPLVAKIQPFEDYDIDPTYLVKGYDVGMGLLEQGQYEKAQDVFFLLTFLDPSVYQYWLGLGICYAMLGDHPDAIVFYNIALPISSKGCYIVMLWMVDSFIAINANNEARELLEVIVAVAGQDDEPESVDAKARAEKKLADLPPSE